MRLTLRTMLAYIDEILEPDDAADIGKKIQESEFATALMHRLRDSTRRLRLGAPATLGKGLALDPNTVAEYLDNTLDSEKVAEFEKICLESDVHLAEVAACHEVLTLVLAEPAQVDPTMRERMYHLIHTVGRTPPGEVVAPPVIAQSLTSPPLTSQPLGSQATPPPLAKLQPPPVEPFRRRGKPEIPDYLRADRKSYWSAIAAVLLLGILLAGGFALAAPDRARMLIAQITGRPVDQAQDASARAAGDDEKSARPVVQPSAVQDTNDSAAGGDDAQRDPPMDVVDPDIEGDKANATAADAATDTGTDEVTSSPPPTPDETAASDAGNEETANSAVSNNAGVRFPDRGATDDSDRTDVPLPPEPENPTALNPDAPTPDDVMPDATPADLVGAGTNPGDEAGAVAADAGRQAAGAPAIGRYLSERDVLLRQNSKTGEWQRVSTRATLVAGDRVLALPSYKPTISLSSGITIQPVGAAEFELEPLDESGVPGVKIVFGQFIMLTLGKAANPLRLTIGEHQATVVFGSIESTLALEVKRLGMPGADPEQQPGVVAADLYATSGLITWDEQGTKSPLQGPAHKRITQRGAADVKEGDFPRWINEEPSSFLKRGAAEIERTLAADRPALLSLRELSDNPREETRALAIQAAAYAGDYGPLGESLSDAGLTVIETTVSSRTEALRAAVAKSPESAAALRDALLKRYGDLGAAMYRMQWGYTTEQLESGEAAKLAGYLDHEELPMRSLGSIALQEATGLKIKYRPTDSAERRKTSVKQWKDKLKERKLLPATTKTTSRPTGARNVLERAS